MTSIIVKPLQWYVDRLANNDYFSLARYGDGELYCMWGHEGENCDGSAYTPELRRDLQISLKQAMHRKKNEFIYGLQRVLPVDATRLLRAYPNIHWHDSEIFGDALVEGTLFPLIDQLRNMRTVIIGNHAHCYVYATTGIRSDCIIEIPKTNAHVEKLKVYESILRDRCDSPLPTAYLFSCGMAANVFISELHELKLPNTFLLDLGHIWDPFIRSGVTRGNTENLTDEQIRRNLRP